MGRHDDRLVRELSAAAQRFRLQVLDMVHRVQTGHIGGSFSAAEIMASLYLHHLKVDPGNPAWPERDRFLLSKGHAAPVLYVALASRGFLRPEELLTLRQLGSRLAGHPEPGTTPGVEIAAGPLGHGLAIGCGMALAFRLDRHRHRHVYVLLGDGEVNAGLVWEAAMVAAKYKLDSITAILDCNGVQQTGSTADVMPTEPMVDKWRAFGWHTIEINGHNVREVLDALDAVADVHAQPTIIVARTTKGKGVSFMEYDHRWHGKPPTDDEYARARAELERGLAAWEH
jgi:transketolase